MPVDEVGDVASNGAVSSSPTPVVEAMIVNSSILQVLESNHMTLNKETIEETSDLYMRVKLSLSIEDC